MNACSRWQRIFRRAVQSPALCAYCGGILGLATIILGVSERVDTRLLIALAVPATVLSIGGLINMLIPDALTAWRRGFAAGCQAGAMAERDGLHSGSTVKPSAAKPKAMPRTPGPLTQHDIPPAAL